MEMILPILCGALILTHLLINRSPRASTVQRLSISLVLDYMMCVIWKKFLNPTYAPIVLLLR